MCCSHGESNRQLGLGCTSATTGSHLANYRCRAQNSSVSHRVINLSLARLVDMNSIYACFQAAGLIALRTAESTVIFVSHWNYHFSCMFPHGRARVVCFSISTNLIRSFVSSLLPFFSEPLLFPHSNRNVCFPIWRFHFMLFLLIAPLAFTH